MKTTGPAAQISADRAAFAGYDPGGYFCESSQNGSIDPGLRAAASMLARIPTDELRERAREAESELASLGITFTVYSEGDAIDRVLPFDVLPRVISAGEWREIERGIEQRVRALNAFLSDVYGEGRAIRDGIVPAELVYGNPNFRPEMREIDPPKGVWSHVDGTDLVRGGDGRFYVLEDNARCPSGVSYVVENRHLMQRAFSDLMTGLALRPVSSYGRRLRRALEEVAPEGVEDPTVALLTPGVFNSAFFEHVFLAREMGAALVEGRDLIVEDDRVYMRTIRGLAPVHVLYRRIDDDFLDPERYREDSVLGARGLMRAYAAGNVTIANAVGVGVADDKAIYAYTPRLVKYYTGEEPILPIVETHICGEPEGLAYALDNLRDLVIKPVGGSGGYGVVIGPRASKAELEACRAALIADPANYIAQPTVALSVAPTLREGGVRPRHVDLRPFAVTGASTWVLPGGLTRVALAEGSLVVNSSQGGGSKDTWVLADPAPMQWQVQKGGGRARPDFWANRREASALARSADEFFWLARYVERAENLARLIEAQRAFGRERSERQGWRPLLSLFADLDRYLSDDRPGGEDDILFFYTVDESNPTSIRNCLRSAKACARAIRPLISAEAWRQLNDFEAWVRGSGRAELSPSRLSPFLERVKRDCQAHRGIVQATQYRDDCWSFYRLGRTLERADQTSRALDAEAAQPDDFGDEDGRWLALLRSVGGYHAFSRRRPSGFSPSDVARFLLCEVAFPRSLAQSLESARTELLALAAGEDGPFARCAAEAQALRARLDWPAISDEVEGGGLHALIDELQLGLADLTDEIRTAIGAN